MHGDRAEGVLRLRRPAAHVREVARAGRDHGLGLAGDGVVRPGFAAAGHPRTLRQLKWANAMLKVLSPQILTS
ncbi:hypothetical protein [Amycolatopsis sp. NPDC049159]|uniref:hypothetical protein n=1 Tax=Amycolatopsis sp. NPDC049159 TaxID=3157210 RepID=UPI0033D660B9